MRKFIVSNIMSLDGYYTGPGNNVMVLPMDEAFDAYNAERLRAADTLLLGRTTYEGYKGFWPSVADDPKARPIHREISRRDCNRVGSLPFGKRSDWRYKISDLRCVVLFLLILPLRRAIPVG